MSLVNNNFEYEYMHVSFYSLFYSLPFNFSGIVAIFCSVLTTIYNKNDMKHAFSEFCYELYIEKLFYLKFLR